MDYAEQIGPLLAETARAWRFCLDRRLKPLGLSRAKWMVLVHLSKNKGGMVQKDLACRLGIEGPTLVGLLDRMSHDGWIERRPFGGDRRSKTVHLTDKAKSIADDIHTTAAVLRHEILEGISDEDLEHCVHVLQWIKSKAESR